MIRILKFSSSLLNSVFIIIIGSCILSACVETPTESTSYQLNINLNSDTLQIFAPNYISTPLYERDIAIAPNQKEIIYTLGDYKQKRRCLVICKNENGVWQNPELLPFSGMFHDIEPFYSVDGSKLYFASTRPIFGDSTRTDYNIWYSNRTETGWSEPIAIDSIINTKGQEYFPSLSKHGNLYFTATRENGIGSEDIFVSQFNQDTFGYPQPLPEEINSKTYEFNAYISPNEDLLIFGSFGRPDGFGGGDLYISKKDSLGHWTMAENLGTPINSESLDYCPFIDWKSKRFYFTSERALKNNNTISSVEELHNFSDGINNGFGNIYTIAVDSVKQMQ